jgi:DNA-binding SARP family transcriptional activator
VACYRASLPVSWRCLGRTALEDGGARGARRGERRAPRAGGSADNQPKDQRHGPEYGSCVPQHGAGPGTGPDPAPEIGVLLPAEDQARLGRVFGVADHDRARDALDEDAPGAPVASGAKFGPVAAFYGHCVSFFLLLRPVSPGQAHDLLCWYASGFAAGSRPVRFEYGEGSVIRFEILGEVTARQDDWTASLSRQQQHLLAALVMGKGAPVARERLEEILWDSQVPYPEGGIKRVASEVRGELRLASPDGGDPLPSGYSGYRLAVTPEQADVLRFRAMAAGARRAAGPPSGELMRQALREWGPDAVGLHGGYPLRGLPGQWADSTRHLLRTEYRDAVIHCLAHDMNRHDYGSVLAECEQRAADDPQALRDDEFTGLWMRAAASSRDRVKAHQVFRRAAAAADRAGEPLSVSLQQLNADLDVGKASSGAAVPATSLPGHDAILRLSWVRGNETELILETSDFNVSFGRSMANRVYLPDHHDHKFHGQLMLAGATLRYHQLGKHAVVLSGATRQLTIEQGETVIVGDKERLRFASGTVLVGCSLPDLYDPNARPTSTDDSEG